MAKKELRVLRIGVVGVHPHLSPHNTRRLLVVVNVADAFGSIGGVCERLRRCRRSRPAAYEPNELIGRCAPESKQIVPNPAATFSFGN